MKKEQVLESLDTFEELVSGTYEPSELKSDPDCQKWVDENFAVIEFLRKEVKK